MKYYERKQAVLAKVNMIQLNLSNLEVSFKVQFQVLKITSLKVFMKYASHLKYQHIDTLKLQLDQDAFKRFALGIHPNKIFQNEIPKKCLIRS